MTEMNARQKRFVAKRRKATVQRALRYLNEGLAGLAGVRKGTAEKRVRNSPQPMGAAKALVKEWRGRRRAIADGRAALIRAAYAAELGHAWPPVEQREAA